MSESTSIASMSGPMLLSLWVYGTDPVSAMMSPQELAVQFYLQLLHPHGAVINERYPRSRGRTERGRRVWYFVPLNMHAKAFNPR